jgi:DNA-binding response OmpR family regulator
MSVTAVHPVTSPAPGGRVAVVLLVEQSEITRRFLADNLAADRFAVRACADAPAALRDLRAQPPDLVLVDLDLPDAAGLDLVARVRTGGPEDPWDPGVPVLAMSRQSDPVAVVRAIDRGADDHVVRPFHYAELLARANALMRRTRGQTVVDHLRVGNLLIDRRARSASVDGRPLDLSAKEFALLDALARDPRRVLTKQELLRDVWGYLSAGRTRTVDSHASRLRRKLAAGGAGNRYVANVWGVGYRLLPEGV